MSGCVFSADRVLLLPANEVVQIKGILKENESVSSAVAGDRVELGLSGLSDDSVIVAGSVLCDAVQPVQVVDLFEAKIITVDMRVPIVKVHPPDTDELSPMPVCVLVRVRALS